MTLKQRKISQKVNSTPQRRDIPEEVAMPERRGMFDIISRQPKWIILAVCSGACAAFNGVFAKLTTTALTSTLSTHIATAISLSPDNKIVDVCVRGFFFGMNLLFNAAMWALFTAALTRADSTTKVSVFNVSSNFMITAFLGWLIFSESLPLLWWPGAAMLAIGNIVIGRREEAEKPGGTMGLDETREEAQNLMDDTETDLVELDDSRHDLRSGSRLSDEQVRIRKGEDVDAPI